MPSFTLEKLPSIKAREEIFQLVIDGVGQLDEFESEAKVQYARQFQRVLYILEQAANGTPLTRDRFREYKSPKSITLTTYECKGSDLRLYVAQIPNGKIIVLGGMKNRQKKDFRRLNSLLEQLQDHLTESKP